jgi:urate oxidase
MTGRLGTNSYGKSRVRVMRVVRDTPRHELSELSVDVCVWGDFADVHETGDNAAVLPTDTMKNTVYVLARQAPAGRVEQPEEFGLRLAQHLLGGNPQMRGVEVECTERRWHRIAVDGAPHDHAFAHGEPGTRVGRVTHSRGEDAVVRAAIRDLLVLKSTESGFSGFKRDANTTLPETDDRIFATSMDLEWVYAADASGVDFEQSWLTARQTVLEVFATTFSPSVQQTGYAAGRAVLAALPEVSEIGFRLPNKHYLPVNLAPFGFEDGGHIYVPTDEPHGQINVQVVRD